MECEDGGLLEFDGPQMRRHKTFRRQTLKIQTADLGKSLRLEAAYLRQILTTGPPDYMAAISITVQD